MNVTLIYGGRSGEHEVSLVSAASIARGICKDSQTKINLIAITKDGKWYLQDDSELKRICEYKKSSFKIINTDEKNLVTILPGGKKNAFVANNKVIETDVVFPALHGTYGEDGTIQGLLEMADIPFVGCSTTASAITMDKEKTKMIWQSVGLPVVPYVCMKKNVMLNSVVYDEFIKETIKELNFPLFVKPCSAGSSNGASKAENEKELSFAIMQAFLWDDKVLIEKAIDAREIECSVTGNSVTSPSESETETVTAYIPGEIVPKHKFYDYDAKYNDEKGADLEIPALISENDIEKIRKTAVAAYKSVDASGLSRVDFFIDRKTNAVYLNEINTMPGFTSISMFPKLCEAAGLDFENLIKLLIDEAIKKYESKSALITSR